MIKRSDVDNLEFAYMQLFALMNIMTILLEQNNMYNDNIAFLNRIILEKRKYFQKNLESLSKKILNMI